MDLSDALVRSMAAIDSSRNKQQATVLLNYRCRKLIAQLKLSRKQNRRTRRAMREACATVVSGSFSTFAHTGRLLERWDTTPLMIDTGLRPLQGSEPQPVESAPRQLYKVQKAGQATDDDGKINLYA